VVFKLWQVANQRWEEPLEQGKAVRYTEESGLGSLQACEG
jgi:hypothetical protein